MTQKKSGTFPNTLDGSERKRGTRIDNAPPDLYDPNVPRLGRRESEPHAMEVTYLHDVLTANFPSGRALWDLQHYFVGNKGSLKGKEIDIQFDISFFKDLIISHTLSSYDAHKNNNKIPDMTINVLSKSTWRNDLSENIDACKDLEIPVYAIFSPYKVTSKVYHPPFLRVFILQDNGMYRQEDLRNITLVEGEKVNEEQIIDVSDKLPFRFGLMQLKKEHEGKQSLYRLVLIDPLKPEILPTSKEKTEKEAEENVKKAEKEVKEMKDLVKKYTKKFGKLE